MTIITLSPKYQIVIPKEVRRKTAFKPGKNSRSRRKGGINLRPVLSPDQLIGYLKGDKPLEFERVKNREL